LLSAIFYIWAPYHSVDVFVRGAMNEAWAFVWFPLIFWSAKKLIENEKLKYLVWLAFSYAMLLLSHNIMVMIFTPLMLIWIFFWMIKLKKLPWQNRKLFGQFFLAGLWALGLAAFFTLPMFFEKKYTHIETMFSGYFACLAISLQLEAASAVFYLPAVFFLIWLFKVKIGNLLKQKHFWLGVLIFGLSLLPQAAFEIKNNFLMTRNLLGFFTGEVNTDTGRNWAMPTKEIIGQRLVWYYRAFFTHLDPNLRLPRIMVLLWFFYLLYRLLIDQKKFLNLVFIFWSTPLIFLFFFVGNYGNLYDYYLTGFFPVFILLFTYVLTQLPMMAILVFGAYFLWQNSLLVKNYLSAGVDGPEHISLGNQKQVIAWICNDAEGKPFNVDVYVPPVIPYAWDYLWHWYGGRLNCQPSQEKVDRLYTIWEVDPPHPERLEAWLERQAGIGKIETRARFGGIGVERRMRIK